MVDPNSTSRLRVSTEFNSLLTLFLLLALTSRYFSSYDVGILIINETKKNQKNHPEARIVNRRLLIPTMVNF